MSKKLPQSEEMQKYIEADIKEKAGEKQKAELRSKILDQLREGDYEGITLASRKSIVINEDKFYDWVKETWPEKLDSLRIERINPEKFEEAFAKGDITYDEIPAEVYYEKTIDTINITGNRRKNK